MQKKAVSKRGGAVRDITAKKVQDDDSFRVHRIHDEAPDDTIVSSLLGSSEDDEVDVEGLEDEVEQALSSVEGVREKDRGSQQDVEPKDFVKVKFSKFVQLVSSRDCSDVVNANPDEEIVMSSNLLTELAGSHDEREEKKIPLVFLVGLAIGVVLTYILIMK